MKRNLLAAFLAVALVMALVFVVAPNAKATGADHTFTADEESYTVEGDCVIDLAGFDVSITVAEGLEAAPTVTVIDSKNLEDLSGASAGTLTVNGDCTIDTVSQYGDYRYLKVENKDENGEPAGTYAFYPFNMSITMAGINAEENTVSLELKLIASGVAQELLTEYGLYKHNGTNAELYVNAAENYPFEEGKYEVLAYFDLTGSLTEEMLNEDRLFSAYVKIDGMEEPIVSEQRVSVVPAEILGRVNEEYAQYEGTDKTLAKVLFFNNPHLRAELTAIEDATKLVSTYEKITSIDELENGKYVLVVTLEGKSYALGTAGTYNAEGTQPTDAAVQPAIDGNFVTDTMGAVCELIVEPNADGTGKTVTILTPDGTAHIRPDGGYLAGNTFLVSQATNPLKWTVEPQADGTFRFCYAQTDTAGAPTGSIRYLAYRGFFRTRTTFVGGSGESYAPDFTLYKEFTSEELNCTDHADKNGAEGGNICDFCGSEIIVIPDSMAYDINNFGGENSVNRGKPANGLVLDDIVSLTAHENVNVSAGQPCITISPDANATKLIHLTINSKFNISQIQMKLGSLTSSMGDTGRKLSCTIEYLDANGESLGSQAVAEFENSTDLTIDLPEGCRAVRIQDATTTGTWFGVYSFTLTFAK